MVLESTQVKVFVYTLYTHTLHYLKLASVPGITLYSCLTKVNSQECHCY